MADSTSESRLATFKAVLSTATSIAAALMVVKPIINEFLPQEFNDYVFSGLRSFFGRFSNELTMVVEEYDGIVQNEIYESAVTYLATKVSPKTRRLKVSRPENEKNITVQVVRDEEIVDAFKGVKIKWVLICRQVNPKHYMGGFSVQNEVKSFEVSFHYKFKDFVLESYLPYIVEEAKNLKELNKTLKIFTLESDGYESMDWNSVSLDHPSTFDTLAMDNELKNKILSDLQRFVDRKDYYKKVGKAWKRGYLLYGPPGTGKSSLIAAMANHLNFDIYDLELTEIKSNTDLRRLLLRTANRSILVVEDIDCTVELHDRLAEESDSEEESHPQGKKQKQVTLSGFLNFIDGLWSSCGDERIIVFTTNHKEKLDPALIRPGRMDVHIHLSYCTPCGFRLLAQNYLEIKEHMLFKDIEELIINAQVTPAEVAEELMKGDESENVLKDLIEFLKVKTREREEKEAEESSNGEKDQFVVNDGKNNEADIKNNNEADNDEEN